MQLENIIYQIPPPRIFGLMGFIFLSGQKYSILSVFLFPSIFPHNFEKLPLGSEMAWNSLILDGFEVLYIRQNISLGIDFHFFHFQFTSRNFY